MDLLCTETVAESEPIIAVNKQTTMPERKINTALEDPVIFQDRCLQNLLKSEERFTNVCSYLDTFSNEITPDMRKIVAEWMLAVCEEQHCQEEVFSLAMNYLDRFLCVCVVHKTQLQLLATACMLLASKLREPSARCLPPDVLVFYTENSITVTELIKMELLILSKLKWDMSAVTPQDFLGQLLTRLPLGHVDGNMVLRHAQTFIALAARDHVFSRYTPSTICAASIAAALQGLDWSRGGITLGQLIERLHQITGVEQEFLQSCLQRIDDMFKDTLLSTTTSTSVATATSGAAVASGGQLDSDSDAPLDKRQNKLERKCKAETPTDIGDVDF